MNRRTPYSGQPQRGRPASVFPVPGDLRVPYHPVRRRVLLRGAAAATALTLLCFGGVAGATEATALAVIVGPTFGSEEVSRQELRQIFLGNRRYGPGGKRLIPLNQVAGSPGRVHFDNAVLGMSADEAGRYWIDRKIRGQGTPPRAVASPALLVKLVANLPGAIAYVPVETVGPGVVVLKVDGLEPGNATYPLAQGSP